LLHRLIRYPLGLIPKTLVLPILSGPGRGLRWVAGAGTHGCWIGTYERDRQQRLFELLKSGECFLDIGANVGFYSLLASRLVGPQGTVHAFEPFPRNLEFVRRHIGLNNIQNINVHATAISDGDDRTMRFATCESPSCGHLTDANEGQSQIDVRVTSLDALWKRNAFLKPAVIKIDVEGAEFGVLSGGIQLLRECRPIILLAGHGTAVQQRCCQLLQSWNYRVQVDRDGEVDGMYESTALPVN
jgi:FkbM family methyltransferase